MNNYKLILITPEKQVINKEIVKLTCINEQGQFQILANYQSSIIITLPTITLIEDSSGTVDKLFTSNGIIRVKNNEVVFCVDAAEWPQEIDISRAQQAKERAEKRLTDKQNVDVKRAQLSLYRALARLKING